MFNQQNGKKTLNTFAIVVRSVMHFPLLRIEEGIAPFFTSHKYKRFNVFPCISLIFFLK